MWIAKFVLIVIVMSVVLLLAGLNASQTVDLNLLFTQLRQISLVLVILLSFICGMFVVLLISVFRELQLKSHLRRERKSRSKLEKELIALRNRAVEETMSGKPAAEEGKPGETDGEYPPSSDAVDGSSMEEDLEV